MPSHRPRSGDKKEWTELNSGISIGELHELLVEFRDRRDWKKFHTPKDLALSISIESAELLELFQWKSDADVEKVRGSSEFAKAAADEIADVLIYLVLLAAELGVDPVEAAIAKISANEKRFPAPRREEFQQ
jgi:NTP pyrophosphatase (non-canonical NTP hydrolase)